MDYFVLRDQKTGEIIKIGRYGDNGIAESLRFGEWIKDPVLDNERFDCLLEAVSEKEADEIIAQKLKDEKIAA